MDGAFAARGLSAGATVEMLDASGVDSAGPDDRTGWEDAICSAGVALVEAGEVESFGNVISGKVIEGVSAAAGAVAGIEIAGSVATGAATALFSIGDSSAGEASCAKAGVDRTVSMAEFAMTTESERMTFCFMLATMLNHRLGYAD
ncbi:MAG: hypothetical protein KDE21_14320 [Novosphingobium sp.]|nr:hypothetical protein [Novosphingobium sp.]